MTVRAALVTGASGFIGRHLCHALQQRGVRVRALLRQPQPGPWDQQIISDFKEQQLPEQSCQGIDTLFHLAAKVHAVDDREEDADEHDRLNRQFTAQLVALAAQAGVGRMLFFSSVKAMGEGGEQRLSEQDPASPTTAYGRSKLAAEQLVLARDNGIAHTAVLRLPLVYGPTNKGNLPRMIAAIRRRRWPPLPPLTNRRSMVHVEDVVQAALLAVEKEQANRSIYLVTDGRDYSTTEIYTTILSALGRPQP
ncbi:MAG: NAD-dependent epimerase/dehydratase family protein, partial [Magnetococcales bacterium]|nr:NAD-dependent epimerase/dehydratase family protein [Magnetococcales bacterium]